MVIIESKPNRQDNMIQSYRCQKKSKLSSSFRLEMTKASKREVFAF